MGLEKVLTFGGLAFLLDLLIGAIVWIVTGHFLFFDINTWMGRTQLFLIIIAPSIGIFVEDW